MQHPDQILSFHELVFDSLSEPIYAIDANRNILLWNKAIQELTGISDSAVLTRPIDDVVLFKHLDVQTIFADYKPILELVEIGKNQFRTFLEPIVKDNEVVGYRGSLYSLKEGILKVLPRNYLIEVINASPISAVVFNTDGSILYTNNSYRDMWGLSTDDLYNLNKRYNILLDRQLEGQGLMPQLHDAFKGVAQQTKPFKYTLNTATLGREDEVVNWLIAHVFPILNDAGEVLYVVLSLIDVTDQYKLEEAYKKNKDRLRLAMEGGALGTWDWDLTRNEITYNRRWAEMLNYRLDEVYDLTWENMLHPDDKEKALSALNKVVKGDKVEYDEEYRLKTKSGGWKWILDRGKVVETNQEGQPIRIAGTHIDINERKLVEEKIKESEKKYKKLIENAPIGISIVVDSMVAYGNEELVRMAEATDVEEIIGLPAREFIPTDERYKIFLERQMKVMEKGESAPLYATQLRTVKGNLIDVRIVSIPTMFNGHRAMQVLIHNVTETVQAQMDLARSENLLHQLFDNSPMGIVLLDVDFNISDINKGFEKIFKFRIDEIRGRSLIDFIIPPELVDEANHLNSSAKEGKRNYLETYRYTKTGKRIPVIIYSLPIITGEETLGIYGIYIDISKRVEIEEELKIRNNELDNFVYKVSHDLRAPLASTLGLINLTRLEGNEGEKDHYISLMEKQVTKLDFFIRDILSHSKNLKLSLSPQLIDFESIIGQCFEDLSYLKGSEHVIKKILIGKGDFYGDKFRISEIFRNIISNAIKYHNPVQKENIINVEVLIDKKGCNITIKDNGIGIHEEILPHVMEMFYRGTESSDGSGIGLYIVQKAVEKIGGKISMDSQYKEGTTFEIWLPSLRNLIKE